MTKQRTAECADLVNVGHERRDVCAVRGLEKHGLVRLFEAVYALWVGGLESVGAGAVDHRDELEWGGEDLRVWVRLAFGKCDRDDDRVHVL
jgi:hypothetical protein